MTNEEQHCLAMLNILKRNYEKDAKPYIDRLVGIGSCKPPKPAMLNYDQWAAIQDNEVMK